MQEFLEICWFACESVLMASKWASGISWGMPSRGVVVPLILTGKCVAGHVERDIKDSTIKKAILNGAVVQHTILVFRGSLAEGSLSWQCFCFSAPSLFIFLYFSFPLPTPSQEAGVAEELDLELLLPCISHRISSFRAQVLRRKQMLALLRQNHAQSWMLSKQRLQPKCLLALQSLWESDRSSLSLSWARRSMGSTIHPSCTAGRGLAEDGFLMEASLEDQLRLVFFSQPLFCSAHCARTLSCRAVKLLWLKIACSLCSEDGQRFLWLRDTIWGRNSLGK